MKARLITNGILSIINGFIIILFPILMFKFIGHPSSMIIFSIIFGLSSWGLFAMGVLTLAMEKDDESRGLAIASGVLSIIPVIGSVTFVTALASFIGASKTM